MEGNARCSLTTEENKIHKNLLKIKKIKNILILPGGEFLLN